MKNRDLTRRGFVKQSLALATPAVLAANALPLTAAESESGASRKLKVVCVGGHPDDPESGIRDKSLDEAAKIRSAECEAACTIMGAKPVFFGQIDGATELNKAHVDAMTKLLSGENPDVLFTHWPIDTHMDHQVASLLAIRAWMALTPKPQLYFFEVNSGSQSLGFLPDTYVDISAALEKKKAALFAHVSQDGQGIWQQHHEIIANWRGREAGVGAAEAFVQLNRGSKIKRLPGL